MENKFAIVRPDLRPIDLKKIGNCMYVKKKLVDGSLVTIKNYSPSLYAKVRVGKHGAFLTKFLKKNEKR